MALPRPISLVAEKAIRLLRTRKAPLDSVTLARELLATRTADETTARRVLETAFAGDPRLSYASGGWVTRLPATDPPEPAEGPASDPDRVLLLVRGGRPARGRPYVLTHVTAIRVHDDDVVAACGDRIGGGTAGQTLRAAVREVLEGAIPVVHDPPGSLAALERWLDEPLEAPVSLRRLAHARLGLPLTHDLETLLERLDLDWRESEDPLELADALDAALEAIRQPGETLDALRREPGAPPPVEWSRFAFDRRFLAEIPSVPGTYQFFDREDRLIYAGKSKNLHRRVGSYFRQATSRSGRVQRLLERLHRIEIEPLGSDLEAMLQEAELIKSRDPEHNVQRRIRPRTRLAARLSSILILEPAAAPLALRAYLIRNGRLLGKIGIGPRGGGLKKIERLLDDHFFSIPSGPTDVTGPDVDVEIVTRWLASNRDRAVAFDPTDMPSAREVTDRLRWFLGQDSLHDPDGTPKVTR